MPGCWAGKDPTSGPPQQQQPAAGIFLKYLSELRPPLLQRAPWLPWPPAKSGLGVCLSEPLVSHAAYRSSRLACSPTPPALHCSHPYPFIPSIIHSFNKHLLSLPQTDADEEVLSKTYRVPHPTELNIRKERLVGLEPGLPGPISQFHSLRSALAPSGPPFPPLQKRNNNHSYLVGLCEELNETLNILTISYY